VSSLLRYNIKGLALYGLYLSYFEIKTKSEIEGRFSKQSFLENPQQYRK